MENYYIIGVVVTKNKMFFCLTFQNEILKQGEVINELKDVRLFFSLLLQEFKLSNKQLLICAEHAGQYNYSLIYNCESENYKLWLENPNRIKYYCSGLQQGKNYKLNSRQISLYASANFDKINIYEQPYSEVEHLKQLHHQLNILEFDCENLKLQLFEKKNYMSEDAFTLNTKRLLILIKGLEEAITEIENEIKCIFAGNSFLSHQMELLTSIEGIENNIALKMIVETDAFTRFENSRQYCSHVGIAPINAVLKKEYTSHAIVKIKPDRGIKNLLNLAALSIIKKNDSELHHYFIRKLKEGKDEKIIINAIRVKLVARMFSVIKNSHKYQPFIKENLKYIRTKS